MAQTTMYSNLPYVQVRSYVLVQIKKQNIVEHATVKHSSWSSHPVAVDGVVVAPQIYFYLQQTISST